MPARRHSPHIWRHSPHIWRRSPRSSIRPTYEGRPAPSIEGVDPDGAPLEFDPRSDRVGILFLTSSCEPCQAIWAGMDDSPARTDMVVITPGPDTESRRAVERRAGPGIPVIMSSAGWFGYGVSRAPWLVVAEAGIIAFEGPMPSNWAAVVTLVEGGD